MDQFKKELTNAINSKTKLTGSFVTFNRFFSNSAFIFSKQLKNTMASFEQNWQPRYNYG